MRTAPRSSKSEQYIRQIPSGMKSVGGHVLIWKKQASYRTSFSSLTRVTVSFDRKSTLQSAQLEIHTAIETFLIIVFRFELSTPEKSRSTRSKLRGHKSPAAQLLTSRDVEDISSDAVHD